MGGSGRGSELMSHTAAVAASSSSRSSKSRNQVKTQTRHWRTSDGYCTYPAGVTHHHDELHLSCRKAAHDDDDDDDDDESCRTSHRTSVRELRFQVLNSRIKEVFTFHLFVCFDTIQYCKRKAYLH